MGSSVTQCNQIVNDFLSISLQVDVTNDSGINGDFHILLIQIMRKMYQKIFQM